MGRNSVAHLAHNLERTIIQQEVRKKEEVIWGTQLADVITEFSEVDAEYYRAVAKYPQPIHLFSKCQNLGTDISIFSL